MRSRGPFLLLLFFFPLHLIAQNTNNNGDWPNLNNGQNGGQSGGNGNAPLQQLGPGPVRSPTSFLQQNNFNAFNYSVNGTSIPGVAGVTLQIQLQSYSNPQFQLPEGRTCVCPIGAKCPYMSEAQPAKCFFSFMLVIASPDATVQYFASKFQTLDSQGNLQRSADSNFDQPYTLNLASKPSSVDIFVHHLGSVIASDGNLEVMSTLAHVDTFVLPLNNVNPSTTRNSQTPTNTQQLRGSLVSDQLTLSYSLSCAGSLAGPNCDLSCNRSTANSNKALCKSMTTGYFSVCQYAQGGQVEDCSNCPWGISEGAYCRDEHGGVLDPHKAGVTDSSFKTATIILGVVSGVLFIMLLLLCIIICIARSGKNREDHLPGHNVRGASRTHEGQAQRPLLQSAPQPLVQPAVPPRTNPPSLSAQPTKSALRKPPMVPPAHLGGSNSINDTLNTSFTSSDVPMRPSRSEVV